MRVISPLQEFSVKWGDLALLSKNGYANLHQHTFTFEKAIKKWICKRWRYWYDGRTFGIKQKDHQKLKYRRVAVPQGE